MKFRYQKIPFRGHDPSRPLVARPFIAVYLLSALSGMRSPYYALLDSGADSVLMPAELAREIGISNIEEGSRESVMGIAGQRADVWYHDAFLEVVGDARKIQLPVGFSKNIFIPILGRSFFSNFSSVAFNELKEEVELRV